MNLRTIVSLFCIAFAATCGHAASDAWMPESRFGAKGKSVTTYIEAGEAALAKGKHKQAEKFFAKVEKNTINMKNKARAIAMQGVCLAEQKEHWQAFKKYEQVLDNFAGYVPFEEVLQREYALAEDYYTGKKKSSFGPFKLSSEDMAEEIYNHVVKVGPYSDLAPQALYKSALISLGLKNYEGAIEKLRRVRSRYRKNAIVADARVALAEALLLAADNADGDGSLVREANRELDRFVDQYPDHPKFEVANALRTKAREQESGRLLELGKFYLRPVHLREPAAKQYLQRVVTDFPDTTAAGEAERLLAQLSGKPVPKRKEAPASDGGASVLPSGNSKASTPVRTKLDLEPAEQQEEPLQSGTGQFLRPVENLESFK
jgi:outer membrane protein assembly factor BamD (BamD/ComL family)